jgi:hypothetical protein
VYPPREWITEAALAQLDVQRHCGQTAWKVQRPRASASEMRGKARVKPDTRVQTTLTTLRVAYEESEDLPEKICSEPLCIRLVFHQGRKIWLAENNMVFEWKEGEIGELVGHWNDDKIEHIQAKE